MKLYLSVAIIFCAFQILCQPGLVRACGIATHTEIAHRASYNYEYLLGNGTSIQKLIKKFQPAFQAGNPYPDSFYDSQCKKGVLHDVSEDTHWVPFLNATIRYIQRKYPKPYNDDALRLIVFTLGYVSHQMADITWHSLGVDQGFIKAMSNVNFHGIFNKAHPVADFGGDVVNEFELRLNYIADLGDWYVPYDDLFNIYNEFYGQVRINKSEIIECSSIMFLGRLGELLAISLIYPEYFNKSLFLTDRLNDYFLGGLDDMATWTQLTWNKVLYMIENGVDACKLNYNVMFVDCNLSRLNQFSSKSGPLDRPHTNELKKSAIKQIIDTLKLDSSYLEQIMTPSGGLIIRPSKKFTKYREKFAEYGSGLNKVASSAKKTPLPLINSEKNQFNTIPITPTTNISNGQYFLLNDYAQLGYSLHAADMNNDGSEDLVMGSPTYSKLNALQNGAVFIQLAQNSNGKLPFQWLNMDTSAAYELMPPPGTISSRFGHAVVVLDLNQDGFNDLIVSAPSFGLQNISYQGVVYVYLGNSKQRYDNEPSITIRCQKTRFCNLGWLLTKGDVNSDNQDDLIISSPYANSCQDQCGLVAVLISKKTNFSSVLDLDQLDLILEGHMPYEWFGFSVKVKYGMITVGAPQSRICAMPSCDITNSDKQAVGRVYFYRYPSQTAMLTLTGQDEFEQYGYDVDLSKRDDLGVLLAVSSTGKYSKLLNRQFAFDLHRAGQVKVYAVQVSMPNNPSANLITVLKSDRAYAGFGSKVQFFSRTPETNADLYVAASKRSESLILVDQVQEGVVYMFSGTEKFPVGNATDSCAFEDLTPCPGRVAQRVFHLNEKRSKFGFNFVFLRSSKSSKITMAISSVNHENDQSRLSGKINLFDF